MANVIIRTYDALLTLGMYVLHVGGVAVWAYLAWELLQ